jgi:hypothetical protein
MNLRNAIAGVLAAVFAASLCGVAVQQRQLAKLKADQQAVLKQLAGDPVEIWHPATEPQEVATHAKVDPELLQLRNEVTQLTARRRELAGVIAENERLRTQVAARGTNAPNARLLLLAKARFTGYGTPENTLESLLWSIQQRDFTNFLGALAPELAQKFRTRSDPQLRGQLNWLHEKLSGLTVLGQRELADGLVELKVNTLLPDTQPETLRLQQFAGEWKLIDSP